MRQLTSPQTLGFSHYQYLVYMHISASGTESYGRRGTFSFPSPSFAKERENISGSSGVERRKSRIVIAKVYLDGTFPSLPTVCSFRAATPYLQVQCLLSLIHIPWPTHPYYPWLSAGLPRPSLPKVYLPIPRLAESHSRIYSSSPFALFTSMSMRVYILRVYVCMCVYAQRTSGGQGRKLSLETLCSWEFIREALVVNLKTTKEPFNFNFWIIYVFFTVLYMSLI